MQPIAPTPPLRRRPRSKKGPIALAVVGAVLVVLLVVFLVVLPRIVAGKVRQAADARALTIDFGAPTLGFSSVTLRDVTIRPRATGALTITASPLTADVSGLAPTAVHLEDAKIAMTGSPSALDDGLAEARAADAKLPAADKLPVEILRGTLTWKEPFGADSSLRLDGLHVAYDPRAPTADVTADGGALVVGGVTLSPLDLHVTETKAKTHALAHLAKDAALVELTHDGDGDAVELTVTGLRPKDFDAAVSGLDLKRTTLDGHATYTRDLDGNARSKGKLAVAKVGLPPISLGPISIGLGTAVRLTWSASPKKGAAGVMKIDEGLLEIEVLGKTRVAHLGGTFSVGDDGRGPFVGNVTWSTDVYPCAELSPVGGVTGNFSASGTFKFDLADLGGARLRFAVKQDCALDLGSGGLGGFLKVP